MKILNRTHEFWHDSVAGFETMEKLIYVTAFLMWFFDMTEEEMDHHIGEVAGRRWEEAGRRRKQRLRHKYGGDPTVYDDDMLRK
jgi:hypothetical protein